MLSRVQSIDHQRLPAIGQIRVDAVEKVAEDLGEPFRLSFGVFFLQPSPSFLADYFSESSAGVQLPQVGRH